MVPESVSRALLVAGGLVVGLVAVETAARLTWTQPWHQRLQEEQQQAESLPYRFNSLGLRDREVGFDKPNGVVRLLVLGDSFTFGQGVASGAAVFPRRLERALNHDAGPSAASLFEVLNGGLAGSVTADWLALWRQVGIPWQPDAVLVVFFLRDGTRTASIPQFFGPVHEKITARNQASPFYRYLYVYRLVRDRLDRRAITNAYLAEFHAAYFGSYDHTAEWRAAQRNLRALFSECRERAIPVGIAVFPVLAALDDTYPFRPISELLLAWARAEGVPAHDLLPAFLGRDASRLWVSPWDQHPNAEAHGIAAESLLPFARSLLSDNG